MGDFTVGELMEEIMEFVGAGFWWLTDFRGRICMYDSIHLMVRGSSQHDETTSKYDRKFPRNQSYNFLLRVPYCLFKIYTIVSSEVFKMAGWLDVLCCGIADSTHERSTYNNSA